MNVLDHLLSLIDNGGRRTYLKQRCNYRFRLIPERRTNPDRRYIAMCGITRTLSRKKLVGLTDPYIKVGKSPLIRKADQERYKSLPDIDQPGVKIGVNPGGTNEKFVRANIKQTEVKVIPKNLEIPDKIVSGEVDVMITDNVEAMLVAASRPELYAVAPDKPLTRDDFGYMVPRDDFAFINWLDL